MGREIKRGDVFYGGSVHNDWPRSVIIGKGAFMTGAPPRPGADVDEAPSLEDILKMLSDVKVKIDALASTVKRR